jgi:hypothetical protein
MVSTKNVEDVILEAKEKARASRVSLPTTSASKLCTTTREKTINGYFKK